MKYFKALVILSMLAVLGLIPSVSAPTQAALYGPVYGVTCSARDTAYGSSGQTAGSVTVILTRDVKQSNQSIWYHKVTGVSFDSPSTSNGFQDGGPNNQSASESNWVPTPTSAGYNYFGDYLFFLAANRPLAGVRFRLTTVLQCNTQLY